MDGHLSWPVGLGEDLQRPPIEITAHRLIRRVVDDEAEGSAEEHHAPLAVSAQGCSSRQSLQHLLNERDRRLRQVEANYQPSLSPTGQAADRDLVREGALSLDDGMRSEGGPPLGI